jgi:predicted nucleic acid-binding Zn ribbon protein
MSPRRRSPRPFGLALDSARNEWAPETLLAEVQRVWQEAVGPVIAAEARPARERAGVLTVSCSGSVWAQELDLMAPTILARLNAELGRGRIERLRCVAVPLSEDRPG